MERRYGRDHDGVPLSTTGTSLDVLEVIKMLDGARAADLAAELDLARSTIHKHLTTLANAQFVVKEGSRYHLGLKFFEYGEYAVNRRDSYQLAEQKTNELEERTGRTVDFSVEEHGRLVSLYSELYSARGSEFTSDRRTFYMHNTAGGKAILAQYPRERVDQILDRWRMPAETERTITEREALYDELETIRDQGYARNAEEAVEGLFSVAKPVRRSDGRVFGAISVDSPTYRTEQQLINVILGELESAVSELESELAAQYPLNG